MSAGVVALLGSGEYTAAMNDPDRRLIEYLGGPAQVRAALIPAASALEPGMPQRWNSMGVNHFAGLGVSATPLDLCQRDDAHDAQIVHVLQRAHLVYFSGGNPDYLVETMHDTPAWAAIEQRASAGAVVAGCSAGAMMLGQVYLSIRALRRGEPPQWLHGLGLARGLAILPHFDRSRLMMDEQRFTQVLQAVPSGVTLVGIDEDTMLVRLPDAHNHWSWSVLGRQSVTVFVGQQRHVYHAGQHVPLA